MKKIILLILITVFIGGCGKQDIVGITTTSSGYIADTTEPTSTDLTPTITFGDPEEANKIRLEKRIEVDKKMKKVGTVRDNATWKAWDCTEFYYSYVGIGRYFNEITEIKKEIECEVLNQKYNLVEKYEQIYP